MAFSLFCLFTAVKAPRCAESLFDMRPMAWGKLLLGSTGSRKVIGHGVTFLSRIKAEEDFAKRRKQIFASDFKLGDVKFENLKIYFS